MNLYIHMTDLNAGIYLSRGPNGIHLTGMKLYLKTLRALPI